MTATSDATTPQSNAVTAASGYPSRATLLTLWTLAAMMMILGLGARAVSRTQEARVLETAREMVVHGGGQWMVPHVNERVRLQKPPLAYWCSAVAFKIFTVQEMVGRLPMMVAAWLTVGLVFVIARHVHDAQAGLLASAMLLGTYLLVRWSRLAETDMLVALFVTFACWCLLRGFELACEPGPLFTAGWRSAAGWFHLGAVAMGFAWLAKGPAAFYPLAFFVGLCAVEKRWRPLLLWSVTGAWLTFALLATPWYAYVARLPEFRQATHDLRNSAMGGRGHGAMFWNYFPALALATLPWTPLVIASLWLGFSRWKVSFGCRVLLVWFLSIFLPLCVWKNKQIHYLLPLIPPLIVLTASIATSALGGQLGPGPAVLFKRIWLVLIACAVIAAAALPYFGRLGRGHSAPSDVAVAALVGIAAICAGWRWFCKPGIPAFIDGAAITAIIMTAVVGIWSASTAKSDPRIAGFAITQRYGDRPLCFYRGESLALCFYLQRTIPTLFTSDDEVTAWLARNPQGVVIDPGAEGRKAAVLPAPLEEQMTFPMGDEVWRVYAAVGT